MIDSVQIILFLVIVMLAFLLVVLGVQVFFILRDLRKTIIKANKFLDEAGSLTERIKGPVSTLSGLISGLKAGSVLTIAKFVHGLLSKDKHEQENKKDK